METALNPCSRRTRGVPWRLLACFAVALIGASATAETAQAQRVKVAVKLKKELLARPGNSHFCRWTVYHFPGGNRAELGGRPGKNLKFNDPKVITAVRNRDSLIFRAELMTASGQPTGIVKEEFHTVRHKTRVVISFDGSTFHFNYRKPR